MNSEELYQYIHNDYFMSRIFGGILHIDEFPQYNSNKSLIYIYNTLPSNSNAYELGHWTLILIHPNNEEKLPNEYFDSYGRSPLKTYKNYLNVTSHPYIQNAVRLQGQGLTCGHHVLFYYYHRARGYNMYNILNIYENTSLLDNDKQVTKFYNNTK